MKSYSKFGVTRNVNRGNIVKLSGPSFTEEKRGIYGIHVFARNILRRKQD